MALQRKVYQRKRSSYFQEKNEKNANGSKELWKVLRNEKEKVNQSKIALEKDGTIQFEHGNKKMQILLKTSNLN